MKVISSAWAGCRAQVSSPDSNTTALFNDSRSVPLVSIIIPHWRGYDLLRRCLQSLRAHTSLPAEIVLVDNGCDDGSVAAVLQEFDAIRVVATGRNRGFAGGCNHGLRAAAGRYAVLFNNDAVATPGWLEPLVARAESDARIAACQPKLLSLEQAGAFDYAGAAGGLLDFLGYPFCRGRIFATLEQDEHQYDQTVDLFWASGACCLLRRSALEDTGLFDEDFFAHMEEIDLNWRLHLAGYRIVAVPASVVYHQAGATLQAQSPRKTYLNHRNGLYLLVKNDRMGRLLALLPLRLLLDLVQALRLLVTGKPDHAYMVVRALAVTALRLRRLWRKRSQYRIKISPAEMRAKFYPRSVVWDYFMRGRKRCSDLPQR